MEQWNKQEISTVKDAGKETTPMRRPLHPETIEALALFAEKAGLLAATVIRQHPEAAHTLAFALFNTVMRGFCNAVDVGHAQLRDNKAYYLFEGAWRAALKKTLTDLNPHISNDHPSLN